MTEDLDKRLASYLDREEEAREHGYSAQALHEKVDGLVKRVNTVTDGLAAHIDEDRKVQDAHTIIDRSTNARLATIEASVLATAKTISVYPKAIAPAVAVAAAVRDREASSHDLKEFAGAVMKEAIEGFKSPNETPEERVEKVVDEKLRKRDDERELARLQAAELMRVAEREARIKFWRTVVLSTVSGGGVLAGVIELLRALLLQKHG